LGLSFGGLPPWCARLYRDQRTCAMIAGAALSGLPSGSKRTRRSEGAVGVVKPPHRLARTPKMLRRPLQTQLGRVLGSGDQAAAG
jgi:hypothetical protein